MLGCWINRRSWGTLPLQHRLSWSLPSMAARSCSPPSFFTSRSSSSCQLSASLCFSAVVLPLDLFGFLTAPCLADVETLSAHHYSCFPFPLSHSRASSFICFFLFIFFLLLPSSFVSSFSFSSFSFVNRAFLLIGSSLFSFSHSCSGVERLNFFIIMALNDFPLQPPLP